MTLILPRRKFLAGLIGLVAAPAVVRAESLMRVVAPRLINVGCGNIRSITVINAGSGYVEDDIGVTFIGRPVNASLWRVSWGQTTDSLWPIDREYPRSDMPDLIGQAEIAENAQPMRLGLDAEVDVL